MKSWKLEAVGLSLNVEPYSASDRFHSDTTLWPKIEYSLIHFRPGTYVQEQLLSWKQMEAPSWIQKRA